MGCLRASSVSRNPLNFQLGAQDSLTTRQRPGDTTVSRVVSVFSKPITNSCWDWGEYFGWTQCLRLFIGKRRSNPGSNSKITAQTWPPTPSLCHPNSFKAGKRGEIKGKKAQSEVRLKWWAQTGTKQENLNTARIALSLVSPAHQFLD